MRNAEWRRRAVALLLAAASAGAVEVVPSATPQQVFGGGPQAVEVRFRNDAADTVRVEVRLHLFQLTSATAAPVGGVRAWKSLTVLAGQTVLESAMVEFPQVRASTRFAARWLDAGGKLLGVTEVWAHPDSLLDTLKLVASDQPIGLSDEAGLLRPVLAARGISISELSGAESWNDFRGRLAVVVSKPAASPGELRLEAAALARAKAGLAVVWFRPSQTTSLPALAVTERVSLGRGAVVLAPTLTLAGLAHSPAAQLVLVRLAELALSPPTQLLAVTP